MERLRNPESEIKKTLSNPEKFKIILGLFGNETARERFLGLCREYNSIRASHAVYEALAKPDAENYTSVPKKLDPSPPQRANIHNLIMDTLARLSLRKLSNSQQEVLNEMASRETTAKIIHDYLAQESKEVKSVEDEEDEYRTPKKKSGPSGVAYFHSLGKGE